MSTAQQNHRTTTSSLRALTQAIETHVAREQLSRSGFGKAALNNASFLGRLGRGSDVRLGTADKVLACMNLEAIGPRFLRRVEAFLKVTGIKAHVLGRGALNDPSFVLGLGKGRSPVLGTVDKVSDWMADNASPAELEAVRAAVEDGAAAVPVDTALHEEKREMNDNTGFMKTAQVAAYLGLSQRTLESYRSRGGGPPFYVMGSVVRYLLSDVLKWASTRRRNSTSDDGLGRPVPEDEDEDEENDGAEDEDDDRPDRPGRSKR
ncbi:MAG: helix-turn-helix domain-containing protein [Rhodospirillales bacterium]|nr:helix-turn-helix domain-containing protein [Rhodospirillales bacterium]